MPLDPTLGELSDQQSMTHGPPQPNPARPYVDAVSNFFAPFFNPAAHGGIAGILEGAGHQLPEWAAAPQSVLNNPSANQAFLLEAGIPWKPAELAALKNMINTGKLDFSQLPGRTPQAIYSKLEKSGLSGRARQKDRYVRQPGSPLLANDQEKINQIVQMINKSMTFPQMAKALGVSDKTIRRYINENMGIRLQHSGEMGQGSTRTPSMPSFNLPGEATGDPEYEKALANFLQGRQASPAYLPEVNIPSLEELFDQLTTKRKP